MARVLKREAAKRDVIQQWVWYAETANIEVADRFLTAVDSTLEMLASQPESGLRTFTTGTELQGMRRFPVSNGFKKILLFYFALQDGVGSGSRGPGQPRFGTTSPRRVLWLSQLVLIAQSDDIR